MSTKTIEQIKELEKELSTTKYNKKTQHHIGLIKAKIARLKEKEISRSKSGPKQEGYSVRKTGDGTVILVGFPSVGKSTLLNALTDAKSEIGHYDFTTLTVVPGLMKYNHAKIQILDVPGVVRGAASGRGRGKEVLSVMRSADLAVVIVDVFHPGHCKVLLKEIYDSGLRLNKKRPIVKITKTFKGGITVGSTVKLKTLKKQTIKDVMKEFKIVNADIIIREKINIDQLIDVIEDNKIYIPAITVVSKIDMASEKQLKKVKKLIKPDILISAEENININELKKLIFDKLKIIRVYCKQVRKKADLKVPLILFKGATLNDMCLKLHRDFADKFKFARLWGKSAKFPGQKIVKLKHVLKDKDIVELHIS